ncbi:MAG: SLC13 family permease [Peptococcales bacterium]|jgi:sodium-dependent dicarboxylate transporter 2/3/5
MSIATAPSPQKLTTFQKAQYALELFLPLAIMLIPTNETFTPQLRLFLASTLCGILCLAFENIPQVAVSITMPIFWVFFGIAPPAVVFAPWTQYIPWMMLSGLVLANILERTGLLARIAYYCILKTGATYNGILIGIAVAGFLLTVFVGHMIVPMTALCYGICIALDLKMCKETAGIMLVGAMSCLLPGIFVFTAPLVPLGVASGVTGPLPLLGFFEAWWINLPNILFFVVMVVISIFVFKPSKPINGKAYFEEKLKGLGKISREEWKTLGLVTIFFLFIITQKIHGYDVGWGLAFIPMLAYIPGIGSGTKQDLAKINYGFVLFISACMGIGAVAGSLGLGKIITEIAMPILEGQGFYTFFLLVWVVLVLCNFLMTPLAMHAAFSVPFATLALGMNINPMALYYVMLNAVDQIIFPYEYALYLLSFAFGIIRLKDFMKIMGIKMAVNFVIVFGLLIPWWSFVGFIAK